MQRWMMTIGLLLVAAMAAAQESLDVSQIYLGAQPCRILSGSGSPEGSVTAQPCSVYLRTSDGMVWRKASGSSNTGWVEIGLPSGSANQVLFHNGSAIAFSGTPSVSSLTASSSLTAPRLTASGGLALDPSGDITLDPGGNDVLPGSGYADNFGSFTRKWLTMHAAELWVSTLVAQDVMSTIGGRVVIAPTTELTSDLASGGTSISVKHNNLASGDRVFFEANGQFEAMAVTSGASGSGPYTYSVTRNLDGSGANDWPAGSAVLNTGTTGDGLIDLYADNGLVPGSTQGPTIVGNVRTGTTYSDLAPRWAIGNLNGLYGYSTDIYGAAFGDASNAWLKIDATNGVRIGHGSTTNLHLEADGDASFAGNITASGGTIGGWTITGNALLGAGASVGLTSTVTGGDDVRFFAGSTNPGTAPFRVTEGGALVATNATITGALTAGSGSSINGSFLVNGTISTNKLIVGGPGAALNDDPMTADATAWSAGTITTVSDGKVGNTTLRSTTGTPASPIGTRRTPVDAAKTYRFHVWARSGGSANGTLYAGVSLYTSTGAIIDSSGNSPGDGSLWFYCASAVTAASITSWTQYNCEFGAGTSKTIPSNARTMAPLALLNLGGSAGYMEVQDVRIEEKIPSTLIVNGAITTSHLAADSVTSAQIAAGTIVASDIAAGTITADKMNVTALSAITANLGTVTINTTGSLSSGATGYSTGTGYWLDYNGGSPRFRIGNPSGSRFEWSGSSLAVFGSGFELSDSWGLGFTTASGGSDWARSVWWANGSRIMGRSDVSALYLAGPGDAAINIYGPDIGIFANSGAAIIVADEVVYPEGDMALGYTSRRWTSLWLSGQITNSAWSGGGNRYVCVNNSGETFVTAFPCV